MNVNVWTLNGITIVAQESKDSYWVPALWACAPGGGWVFTSAGSHSSPLLFKAEEILQLTPDCTSSGSVVQLLVLAQCSSLPSAVLQLNLFSVQKACVEEWPRDQCGKIPMREIQRTSLLFVSLSEYLWPRCVEKSWETSIPSPAIESNCESEARLE